MGRNREKAYKRELYIESRELLVELLCKNEGNASLVAEELGIGKRTARRWRGWAIEEGVFIPSPKAVPVPSPKIERVETTRHKRDLPSDRSRRIVVTSAVNNTEVNKDFLLMLENYCVARDATLFVIPLRYRNPTSVSEAISQEEEWYDPLIVKYLCDNELENKDFNFKLLCNIKTQATAENPLSGMDATTRGLQTIIGHPQLQMRHIPTNGNRPIMLSTTGACTKSDFSDTKAGYKAHFNQSSSALVIEPDKEIMHAHIRVLNYHEAGIIDIDTVYTKTSVSKAPRASAMVIGDEHVVFMDPTAKEATFGKGGMIELTNPEALIRHDVLDCHAVSHHHKHDPLLRYKKMLHGKDSIIDELAMTRKHVIDTTPKGTVSYIIASNHNEHLRRWLNETDWRNDVKNAKTFAKLLYETLESIDSGLYCDPFELYFGKVPGVVFLGRNESLVINNIECSNHGDKGFNGSRATPKQYAMLELKASIGHGHSACIEKGCMRSGVMAILRMEYNEGPSGWTQSNILHLANGERQIITSIEGRWRA